MKTLFASVVSFVFCFIGYNYYRNAQERKAIDSVFLAEHACSIAIDNEYKPPATDFDRISMQSFFVHTISKSDLSSCPPDFANTYLEYVKAWKSVEKNKSWYKGKIGSAGGVDIYSQDRGHRAEDITPEQKMVSQARANVEASAVRYGVDPHKYSR